MDTQLISRMQVLINSTVGDDTNKNIASYLLKNLYHLDKLTISDLAANTYTSTASISRFAREIGCDSFNDLKLRFQGNKNIDDSFHQNLEKMDFKSDKPFKPYVENIVNSLQDMERSLNLKDIDELAQEIYNNDNVYFYGSSLPGLLAQNAQMNLILAGKYIHTHDSSILQAEAAMKCPKDSLAIIFSMNGRFMRSSKEVTDILTKRHIRQILVTQEPTALNTKQYHKVVTIGNSFDTVAGRYKLELFLESLVNRYVYKYYFNKDGNND